MYLGRIYGYRDCKIHSNCVIPMILDDVRSNLLEQRDDAFYLDTSHLDLPYFKSSIRFGSYGVASDGMVVFHINFFNQSFFNKCRKGFSMEYISEIFIKEKKFFFFFWVDGKGRLFMESFPYKFFKKVYCWLSSNSTEKIYILKW